MGALRPDSESLPFTALPPNLPNLDILSWFRTF